MGSYTGATRWDGKPHRQPTALRRLACRLRHGRHRFKFGAWPRGACIHCGFWPAFHRK